MLYLLYDVGSTYTKAIVVDSCSGSIVAQASVLTSRVDVAVGMQQIRDLFSEWLVGDYQTLVCSSAKGGLKMVAVGLVPELTMKAAKLVCCNAGAKVVGSYSYKLNSQELKQIEASDCDLILLCGGTDGGNEDVVLHNAQLLSTLANPMMIIYAGNKSCQDKIKDCLQHHQLQISENVMPVYGVLKIEATQQLIRSLFMEQIIHAKGLSQYQQVVDNIIMPTPASVLQALELLSYGTDTQPGIGELMAVDIGGATTDMYSINHAIDQRPNVVVKGLPDPLIKRSVEGDLGLRLSAQYVYEQLDNPPEGLEYYLSRIANDYSIADECYDQWLAQGCVRLASDRHAGHLEEVYTPFGVSYCQSGKDLSMIRQIIGLGGPLRYAKDPGRILSQALGTNDMVLLPSHLNYFIDVNYVVSCLGLLAKLEPNLALKLMKENLKAL
jgi:uncharacterized protein (TIGR01319 family)